jgi:tetratricopeptide (TPR) repeat protein
MRSRSLALVLCLAIPVCAQSNAPAAPKRVAAKTADSHLMPITSRSAAAKKTYEDAMFLAENLRTSEALDKFRAAVKQDPQFATAWAQIARISKDPSEEKSASDKAKALASKASKGEQLLIQWIAGSRENNMVDAISAMNDLQAMYPTDPRLGFMFGQWLQIQNSNDRSIQVLEQTVKANPSYAAAYNELGYAYSAIGNHDKAISTMKRYVELLPNEPNPHDSYAELNRLAGHYDEALKHYHEALRIMPSFTSSQLGLGDTYALMGDQKKAREEYDKAIAEETGTRDKLDYKFQRSMTYVREKDLANAEKSFSALANEADAAGFSDLEAECHRAVAAIASEQDVTAALKHIEEAEAALAHKHQTSETAVQEELSKVMRSKAVIAAQAGKDDITQAALKRLEQMAQNSRDQIVQASYHGAKGGVLFHQKKYADAIQELSDDEGNALSQVRLAEAYEKIGNSADAKSARSALEHLHRVLLEDALVKL